MPMRDIPVPLTFKNIELSEEGLDKKGRSVS
jgi:hypothetical protein